MHLILIVLGFLCVQQLLGQSLSLQKNIPNRCAGDTLTIFYDSLSFSTNSIVFEVSNATGTFILPGHVATQTTAPWNKFQITLPTSLPNGNNSYRIRAINGAFIDTSNYFSIGNPSGSFTFTPNNVCPNQLVNFTHTGTGNGPFSYTWNFTNNGLPNSSNLSNPSCSFSSSFGGGVNDYLIRLSITDVNGCLRRDSNSITVKQRPSVGVFASFVTGNFSNVPSASQNPDTIRKCNNTIPYTLTLSNSSSTIPTNQNYFINWGDATTNFNSSTFPTLLPHTYSNQGEYNMTITVNGTNGCSTTRTKYIYVGTNPSIGLGNPGNTTGECISKIYTFPITGFASNSPGTRYILTSNDKVNDTTFLHPPPISYSKNYNNNSCGFTSLGQYINSYHLRITALNACASSAATVEPIQLSSKPYADFSRTPVVCINTSTTFQNTSKNGRFVDPSPPNECDTTTFPEWSINPSVGWTLNTGIMQPIPTATNSINVTFTQVGIYTIKLKLTTPQYLLNPSFTCGIDSITKTICVEPQPLARFTLTQTAPLGCINNTLNFTNLSNTLNACNTPVYVWQVRDSATSTLLNPGSRFSFGGGTNTNSVNPIIQFTQKGRYAIRLSITNSCGTSVKDTLIIIKDIPVVRLQNDIIYCGNQSLLFGPGNPSHIPILDSSFGSFSNFNWEITPSTGYTFINGASTSRFPRIAFTNATTAPITYRVILKASNECGISLADTQFITINPKPIVTANPTALAICSGNSINVSLSHNLAGAVTFTWNSLASSSFITGNRNQTLASNGPIRDTLRNLGANIDSVRYKIVALQASTNCISDSQLLTIAVYPIPKVIGVSKNICSGNSTNLTLSSAVANSSFTWTAQSVKGISSGFSNQNTPTQSGINQVINNTSNTQIDTIIYTIRGHANGCISQDTMLQVRIAPTPLLTGGNTTICSGDSVKLTANSTVALTTLAYSASLISGNIQGFANGTGSIAQRLINNGNVQGSVRYNINGVGPAPTNCPAAPVNFDVLVQPKPILNIATSSTICSGTNTQITLGSNVTGAQYTYTATLISGTNTSGFYSKTTDTLGPIAQTITNNGVTNAIVKYTITPKFANCNGDTISHYVTIIPGPTPGTLNSPGPFCISGNAFTLTLAGSSGSIVRWEKSVSPFNFYDTIVNLTPSLSISNLTQTARYRVVLSTGTLGSCGTVNTAPITVQIDSLSLSGTVNPLDTVCAGINSGTLTLSGNRGNVLSWQFANISAGPYSNIPLSIGLNSTNYSNLLQTRWYRVNVKNGTCNSVFSESIPVTVFAQPSAAQTIDTSFCMTTIGQPITGGIRAINPLIGIGSWRFLSGPNVPNINNANQAQSSVSNLINGQYLFEWKVINGVCLPRLDTLQLTVHLPLTGTIGNAQTICNGQIPSTLVSLFTAGGSGNYTQQWQKSEDNVTYSNISLATLNTYSPPTLSTDTWYRKIINSGNCSFITQPIKIIVLPAISGNTISKDTQFCTGVNSPIIIGTSPSGGNGTYRYQWQELVGMNWVNTSTIDTLKDYLPPLLSSSRTFRRIITSGPCQNLQASTSNTVNYTVYPLPIVDAGVSITKCSNQAGFKLIGTPANGNWTGSIVSNDSVYPMLHPIGTYKLYYTFTNNNGCAAKDSVNLSIIAPPIVLAGNDTAVCENQSAFLLQNFSPATGNWSGLGISASGIFNPSVAGAGITKLFYSFTAGSGCNAKDSIEILVHPKPNSSFLISPVKCPKDTFRLIAKHNNLAIISNYTWSLSNSSGFSNALLNTYNNDTAFGLLPDNMSASDVRYFIRLLLVSNQGCRDSAINSLLLLRRPLAQFSTNANINCGPAFYNFTNTTNNSPATFLWSVQPNANVNINTTTSINPQITLPVNTSNSSILYNFRLIASRDTASQSCRDTFIATRTVFPKPLAGFTLAPSSNGCSPLTVNFTNTSIANNTEPISSMQFIWSFGNSPNDTNRNQNRLFTNSGVIDSIFQVRLIGTSQWGCKDTATTSVTVYPFPKAAFTGLTYTNCAPFNVTGSNIILQQFPNANTDYKWELLNKSFTIINSSIGLLPPSYQLNSPNDTVYLRLIASNNRLCKPDTLVRMFRTIDNPIAQFNLSDTAGCHPLTINLASASTSGVSHFWNLGNGITSSITNPQTTYLNTSRIQDTIYKIMLVVTAGNTGCKDTTYKNIRVFPKPLASFNFPSNLCASQSINVSNNSLVKLGLSAFRWSRVTPSNTLFSISDSLAISPTFILPDNQSNLDSLYSIKLQVTSIDNCMHDSIVNIVALRRPKAAFDIDNPNCGPINKQVLNLSSSASNSYGWQVNPTPNAINSSNSFQPIISFAENTSQDSINYTIKLTATRTQGNCLDSTFKTITVYPKPMANFTTNALDSCGPRTIFTTNQSIANNKEPFSSLSNQWIWPFGTSTLPSINQSFMNTGTIDSIYVLRLIVTSKHGCKDTLSKSVILRPNAKALFTKTTTISCAPFVISAANVVASAFPEANSNYEWYANQNLIGTGLNFPGFILLNQADSVKITLKAISKNGCKNDSMEAWFYTIENPKPRFIAVDSITCSGNLVQFNNLSTPNFGLSYQWFFGNQTLGSTQNNPSLIFNNYGVLDTTILIKLITIAGGTGCRDSIIKPIVIKPLPNPNFNFSDSINCFPRTVLATINSTNVPPINALTYRWQGGPTGIFISNDSAASSTSLSFNDNQSGSNNVYWLQLKVQSDYGCLDSVQKPVRIPTRPIANFNFALDNGCGPYITAANSISSFTSNFQWLNLQAAGNIVNPTGSSTNIQFPGHRGSIDSIYKIRLIASSIEGCIDSIEKTVSVFPKPIASFSSSVDSGCAPLPVQFVSNSNVKKPALFNWQFGDGISTIGTSDTSNHLFLGSIFNDTIFFTRLIIRSANGCLDTVSKAMYIESGAVANIHLPDTQLCSSKTNPTSLRIENKSYGSVDTFYWSFGDGQELTTTADSNILHPYNKEGYYRITLKAVNDCRESFDTAYVLVQTPPNLLITKTDSVGCSPMNVQFNNLSADTFRAVFNWNMGNGNSYTSFQVPTQTYFQSPRNDTFYYINHSISNVCGNFIHRDTVRVLPKPTSFFLTNTDSGCSPLPVFMQNQSFGVPQQFLWHFGNGDSSTRQFPLQNPITYTTIDTPSTFIIRLIVSNICGSDTSFRKVKVMPNTVKSFFTANVQNGCDALTVQFTDYAMGGQNISWNFGDGSGSSLKNPKHTFNNPGTYRVFQYVNNNCSFDTSSLLINVFPSPAFSLDKLNSPICLKSPVFFKANIIDAGTLTWHFGDGDSSQLINPVHYYKTAGLKVFRATLVSNTNYCSRTLTDSIFINALPGVTLTADTIRACQNVAFRFVGSTQQPSFLIWDFGDSTYGLGYGATHFFSKPGNYQVKVIATNAAGCSDTAINDIIVYPVPVASFGLNPKDTCSGPAWVNFTNTSVGANTYQWTFGNGNSSSNVNERQFFSGIGKYNNQLIATNSFLCKDTSEAIFEIFEKPVPEFTFTPTSLCVGATVNFTNNSKLGASYVWYFGDGDSSTLENPSHVYKDSGQYKVTLFVYAGSVCFDSLSSNQVITVHPKPNPSFAHTVDFNQKPSREVVFEFTGTNGYLYNWQFGDGNIGQGRKPKHIYGESDSGCFEIKLKVSSFYGCDTTISDTICLPGYWKGLFVPNAFTPNYGDGIAKYFWPAGKELRNYHLKIYTKWGELVWESTELKDGSPAYGWDGKHKDTGIDCDQGAYIWTIEATFTDGKSWEGMLFPGATKVVKYGNVTLVR